MEPAVSESQKQEFPKRRVGLQSSRHPCPSLSSHRPNRACTTYTSYNQWGQKESWDRVWLQSWGRRFSWEEGKEISKILVPPRMFCYFLAEMVLHLDSLQQFATTTQTFPFPTLLTREAWQSSSSSVWSTQGKSIRGRNGAHRGSSASLSSHFPKPKNNLGEDEHEVTRQRNTHMMLWILQEILGLRQLGWMSLKHDFVLFTRKNVFEINICVFTLSTQEKRKPRDMNL